MHRIRVCVVLFSHTLCHPAMRHFRCNRCNTLRTAIAKVAVRYPSPKMKIQLTIWQLGKNNFLT